VSDRELLELAAKAAGMEVTAHPNGKFLKSLVFLAYGKNWNPLTDDGDALRLAVKLGLQVDCSRPSAGEPFKRHAICLGEPRDIETLTRRAIVRAAAEIGRNMP
jgi:hypothetical protein